MSEETENKEKLRKAILLLTIVLIAYVGIIILAATYLEEGPLLGAIIAVSTIIAIAVAFWELKIELFTGYYECKHCHHRFVPKNYLVGSIAPHMYTSRYFKCPKCHKRSWTKKVLTKE